MDPFRPFRATVHRHQKYYSEKRNSGEGKGSVFNLPRQTMAPKSVIVINPEIFKNAADVEHKIAADYQKNLKKNIKKQSVDFINRKAFQRITSSFVQMDTIPREPLERIPRNNSSEIYSNKNIAFKTLNILYKTIIETKVRTKKKESFELSAKKLPILQKGSIHHSPMQSAKKGSEVFVKNSSFDKYKLNLTTITNDFGRRGVEKYNSNSERKADEGSAYELMEKDNLNGPYLTRRRRLERGQNDKIANEIVPWNMFEGENEDVDLYE